MQPSRHYSHVKAASQAHERHQVHLAIVQPCRSSLFSMPIDDLTGQFIVLTTYRRNGAAVPTTVWFASVDDTIIVPTGAATGKVKRLRNNPQVTMAKSNFRGTVKGDAIPGTARFLEGSEIETARLALKKKYGIQWRFTSNNTDSFLEIAPT